MRSFSAKTHAACNELQVMFDQAGRSRPWKRRPPMTTLFRISNTTKENSRRRNLLRLGAAAVLFSGISFGDLVTTTQATCADNTPGDSAYQQVQGPGAAASC